MATEKATGYLAKVLAEDETVLAVVRRHWLVLFLKTIGWILLFGATVVWAFSLFATSLNPQFLWLLTLAAPFWAMWLWEYLVWSSHVHVLTPRRVLQLKGVFNKSVVDSALEKLNDVKTSQSILGRLFGYGDLEILTASDSAVNKLRTIAKPLEFKRLMLEVKDGLVESDAA